MPNYRRYYVKQPVFITVVTSRRQRVFVDELSVDFLLSAMRRVREKYPFRHYGHVILPDHFHWLFEPVGDPDFSKVVAAVKREVTWRIKDKMSAKVCRPTIEEEMAAVGRQTLADNGWCEGAGRQTHPNETVGRQTLADETDDEDEALSKHIAKIQLPLWQKRFYDHMIRDEQDFTRHLDYLHYNPVKHGLIRRPEAYPYSSFGEWKNRSVYPEGWGVMEPEEIKVMNLE
jgi:REP element-mobilizing transposase RayT